MNTNIISGLINCLAAIFSLLFVNIRVHSWLKFFPGPDNGHKPQNPLVSGIFKATAQSNVGAPFSPPRSVIEAIGRGKPAPTWLLLTVISRISKCQKPNSFVSRHRELATDASSAIHPATNPAKAKGEETFDR